MYARRLPSTFLEVICSPSFFLSDPDIKPLAVYGAHCVAAVISVIVAPPSPRSIAITASCFVPVRRWTTAVTVSIAFADASAAVLPSVPCASGVACSVISPRFRRLLQTLPTAPPFRLAVMGKIAPSSRAQTVDRMLVWASDRWICVMGCLRFGPAG